jgi:integrase
VSRADIANRYGGYLGFLQRVGRLDCGAPAGTQVTVSNVEEYLADLQTRVRSVTVWNAIYKLRRAAELVTGSEDFSWIAEIENDLALVMQPRSKFDRLVFTNRLLEAGLTIATEAAEFGKDELTRARGVRNGLMVASLALCPIRPKNFTELEIGRTFKEARGSWWIALPSVSTKSRRPDERRVPPVLNQWIELYLNQSRPVLIGARPATNALWISSQTGKAFTRKNLGTLISKITRETIGVDVSPHLFRTAAASTAVAYGGGIPHLASAILNHTDPRVTEDHYQRVSSATAAQIFAGMISDIVRE